MYFEIQVWCTLWAYSKVQNAKHHHNPKRLRNISIWTNRLTWTFAHCPGQWFWSHCTCWASLTHSFQVLDFTNELMTWIRCVWLSRHAKCAAWGTPGASALWVSTDPTSRSECMRICDKHCSIWQFCICKLQVKSHHDCPSLNLTLREAWVDTVDHSKTEKQDCTKS